MIHTMPWEIQSIRLQESRRNFVSIIPDLSIVLRDLIPSEIYYAGFLQGALFHLYSLYFVL